MWQRQNLKPGLLSPGPRFSFFFFPPTPPTPTVFFPHYILYLSSDVSLQTQSSEPCAGGPGGGNGRTQSGFHTVLIPAPFLGNRELVVIIPLGLYICYFLRLSCTPSSPSFSSFRLREGSVSPQACVS